MSSETAVRERTAPVESAVRHRMLRKVVQGIVSLTALAALAVFYAVWAPGMHGLGDMGLAMRVSKVFLAIGAGVVCLICLGGILVVLRVYRRAVSGRHMAK